jgi:hypothetical protein
LIILLGCVFSKEKNFDLISNLEKICLKSTVYILDYSSVGTIIKHKRNENNFIELKKNLFLLGRSGIIDFNGIKVD